MKSILTILIIPFCCCCAPRYQTQNQTYNEKNDSTINCYELKGRLPNLTIENSEYYGKVFLGISYDFAKSSFEEYVIMRSTIWQKSDKSVFSNYDSNTEMPVPIIYTEIIQEIKIRIDNSDLHLIRKENIENCEEVNWLILPVEVK
ncbi:MAG TPA: hypothetical protein PLP11_04740 [Bacteroidales bacterium]|nr:hypothetical protein [Bacteroidales bacterium]